ALGEASYTLTDNMKRSREFSRSLYVTRDIIKGEPFTSDNVRSVRPGYGLPPKNLRKILGRKAKKSIKKGTPMAWNLVD
ncbi:MAG: SAF domain-containing protein, partial [Candidatus Thorarchaeota archaeon]